MERRPPNATSCKILDASLGPGVELPHVASRRFPAERPRNPERSIGLAQCSDTKMSEGLADALSSAGSTGDKHSTSDSIDGLRERIETTRELIAEALLRRGALLRSIGTERKRVRDLKAQATELKQSAADVTPDNVVAPEGQQEASCTSCANVEVESSQHGLYGRVDTNTSNTSASKDTRVLQQRKKNSIECMLLDCELKALEHSEVDPMHGSMRSSGLGGVLPNERLLDDMGSCGPPDMDLQDWVKVRCGCAQCASIGTACKSVARQMLRTDAHTLPGAEWRAKCVKSVQWLQATVRNMRNASPDAVDALLERMNSVKKGTRAESGGKSEDTAISDSAMSQDEVLRWEDVSGATIVACEVMLCEMHAVLRESCSETVEEVVRGADVRVLRARAMELLGTLGIMGRIAFRIAPRGLYATWASFQLSDVVRARDQMRAIGRLEMSEEQTELQAQEWHAWVRQRNALASSMTATLSALERSVPGLSYLKKRFSMVQSVLLADELKSTGETSHGKVPEGSDAHAKQAVDSQGQQVQAAAVKASESDTGVTKKGRAKDPDKQSMQMSGASAARGAQSTMSAPGDSAHSAQDSEGAGYIYVVRRAEYRPSADKERPVGAGRGLNRLSSGTRSSFKSAGGSFNSRTSRTDEAQQRASAGPGASQLHLSSSPTRRQGSQLNRVSMRSVKSHPISQPGAEQPALQDVGGPSGAPRSTQGQPEGHMRSLESSLSPRASSSNDCEVRSAADPNGGLQDAPNIGVVRNMSDTPHIADHDPTPDRMHAANADDAHMVYDSAAAGARVEPCGSSSGALDCSVVSGRRREAVAGSAGTSDTPPVGGAVPPGAEVNDAGDRIAFQATSGADQHASMLQHPADAVHPLRAANTAESTSTSSEAVPTTSAGGRAEASAAASATECMQDMHMEPQSDDGEGKLVHSTGEDTSTVHSLFNSACLQMHALRIDPERSSDETLATLFTNGQGAQDTELDTREAGFLGENGRNMETATKAMHELQDMLRSDSAMFCTATTALFTHLTVQQQARILGDPVETGAPYIDQLLVRKSAAHDRRWKELSMPFIIFE